MPQTKSPGTVTDDASIGTVAWSNPANAKASDDSRATAPTGGSVTHYLKGSSFGFTVPDTAVIEGIGVDIERVQQSAGQVKDNAVRIVKGGAIGTTDRKKPDPWPTTEATTSYGGPTDLWGETWTAADINASGFGCALSAARVGPTQFGVDSLKITVYYT